MSPRVGNITVDCHDVTRVATFWSIALGRPLDEESSAVFASIGGHDPLRSEPAWYFEQVPELKAAKNRMHVDLYDPDPTLVTRLVALGATVVAVHESESLNHGWTVLQDPEGNEFCVAEVVYSG